MTIHLDFETRSACDLKRCGAYQYSLDPTTRVMCLAWAYDDGEIYLWHPAYPSLAEHGRKELEILFAYVQKGEELHAHASFFERAIWTNWGVLEGWPELDLRQLRCTAAQAASFALPRKLEEAVSALGLPFPKDMSGHRLMLKLSRPRKPRVTELRAVGLVKGQHEVYTTRHGYLWHEKPEELTRLFAYCKQDVRAERALAGALRPLPEQELAVWRMDQEINWRGVQVDRAGVDKALALTGRINDEANTEMRDLTFGDVPSCSKRPSFKAWVNAEGVAIPDTQGTTIDEWLKNDLPDHVLRALALWKEVNRTSTKKYVAMDARVAHDSRVRDILRYHAASTGRWGGTGIQPQNFPRHSPKDMGAAWRDILSLTLEELTAKYGDVMDLLAGALRGAICAAPGKELVCADYAQIEARVLFWVAGEEKALQILHAGHSIYKDMSGAIMAARGTPIANPQGIEKGTLEYQLGKQSILALGYQQGWKTFITTCAGYGIKIDEDFAKEVVKLYRTTYAAVPRLWNAIEAAAIEATKRGPRAADPVLCKNTAWAVRGRFLHCKLPGGRLLSYCDPEVIDAETPWGTPCEKLRFMGVDTYTHKWSRQYAYGGKLVDHVIQGTSRDLMAEAMLRCPGTIYTPILTVHDEIVAEVPEGQGSVKEFEDLMATLPAWAERLPVVAEGWRGARYHK